MINLNHLTPDSIKLIESLIISMNKITKPNILKLEIDLNTILKYIQEEKVKVFKEIMKPSELLRFNNLEIFEKKLREMIKA